MPQMTVIYIYIYIYIYIVCVYLSEVGQVRLGLQGDLLSGFCTVYVEVYVILSSICLQVTIMYVTGVLNIQCSPIERNIFIFIYQGSWIQVIQSISSTSLGPCAYLIIWQGTTSVPSSVTIYIYYIHIYTWVYGFCFFLSSVFFLWVLFFFFGGGHPVYDFFFVKHLGVGSNSVNTYLICSFTFRIDILDMNINMNILNIL